MARLKITVFQSSCRGGYHKSGDSFEVGDLCPPMCHELWNIIYPNVMVLLNNGDLDYGNCRAKCFEARCPDNGRVTIKGEIIE